MRRKVGSSEQKDLQTISGLFCISSVDLEDLACYYLISTTESDTSHYSAKPVLVHSLRVPSLTLHCMIVPLSLGGLPRLVIKA